MGESFDAGTRGERVVPILVLVLVALVLWPYWLYCDVVKFEEGDDSEVMGR